MKDFLVTFFVGNKALTKSLNEFLEKCSDAIYMQEFGFPKDFSIGLKKKGDGTAAKFVLKQAITVPYEAFLQDEKCCEYELQHGDYIIFKNSSGQKVARMLLISNDKIGIGYNRYYLDKSRAVFIGRSENNDIFYNLKNYLSRDKHAAILFDKKGKAYVEDLKRTVGVYVNGRLTHSQELQLFDEIYIMGLSIVYCGSYIAVNSLDTKVNLPSFDGYLLKEPSDRKEKKFFVRTPRILKSLDTDVIEIDAPPNPPAMDKTPAILVMGPSVTMSLVMVASLGVSVSSALSGGNISTLIASGIMSVGMLAGSLLWPSLLRSYQKRKLRAEETHRKERYSSYISEIENKLERRAERTKRVLEEYLCPAPLRLCSFLDNKSNQLHLWERAYGDDDFMAVRLGLGVKPAPFEVKIPRQGFQLYEDEMRSLPAKIHDKYGMIQDIPLVLSVFRNKAIGIIGKKEHINTLLHEIVLNITALHAYDEVKLAIITSGKGSEEFAVYKNIPHLWSNDKRIRYFATNIEEVHNIVSYIEEDVKDRLEKSNYDKAVLPHYAILITDPRLVERENLLRYLDEEKLNIGISCIFAYGDISQLPKCCNAIIQSDEEKTGYYIRNQNENRFIPFLLDEIVKKDVARFAKKLSALPVKRDLKQMGIPERVSFLQMLEAGNISELNIEQHWDSNNSAKSLAAPIGTLAGGKVFCLDIHEAYHGCHGLVAGTTGSGKSEFLQAFILSLSINYSPKEVAFVLVDFKGGDMARPFMAKSNTIGLPHLAATISNLSGNTIYRALVSLNAEIKARQTLFNEAAVMLGVDKLDINSYHKYYKAGKLKRPLPHLVIIIDEFAQLKTQLPEFLTELINIAQVGRSLGIHLILATQKPSGIVDPQIQSNSRFKVCLKVAEKQDSVDMINRPDSASIKNPGRLNILVGYNEVYETLQSGYSGADYAPMARYISDDEILVQMTDNTAQPIHSAKLGGIAEASGKTQLEAVVAELARLGEEKGLRVNPLWLPPLPEHLYIGQIAKGRKGLCTATIGMVDYVRKQRQEGLTIDFERSGHIAVYGMSGTGKTTFLHTLVHSLVKEYEYTPDELNIFAMDFGGRTLNYLKYLPHTVCVLFADDDAGLHNAVNRLKGIIEERKRIFADKNCGTIKDYNSNTENKVPVILTIVDNYSSLHDKYYDISCELVDIIAAGKTYGVYFVVTGTTKNAVYYKIAEHVETNFTFKMNDPSGYYDIHNIRNSFEPDKVAGRGLTVINKEIVEFQIGLPINSKKENERISVMIEKFKQIDANWHGIRPKVDDKIVNVDYQNPGRNVIEPVKTDFALETPETLGDEDSSLLLGYSVDGRSRYGIVLSKDNRLCICAQNTQDLEEALKQLVKNLKVLENTRIFFVDTDGYFENVVEEQNNAIYVSGTEKLDELIIELKQELNVRVASQEDWNERLIFVIPDYNRFFELISDSQADFFRKLLRYVSLPEQGTAFVCGYDVREPKSNDSLFMALCVNAANYIICSNAYETAATKMETLAISRIVNTSNVMLNLAGKTVAIKW